MTAPAQVGLPPAETRGGGPADPGAIAPRPRRRSWRADSTERGLISARDMERRRVRIAFRVAMVLVLGGLVVVSAGPLLWLAKFAISTTPDIVRSPLAFWPSGVAWENIGDAWTQLRIGRYLLNTFWVAGGSWVLSVFVAATGGYALSVLRPRYGGLVTGAVLATLFIPSVVSLVPLYLTILDLPLIHANLINTYWAVWLPASASAFNLLIVKRFFDNLPRDLFDAAKVDGAGPTRLFWSIVLPMSRPVIGVVSLFTIISAWEAFLWPMLVLPDATKQPLSVALPRLEANAEVSLLMAGMLISTLIPIVIFLIFQRQFLRGASQLGMVKG